MSTNPTTGLPADWEVRHSKSRNLPYYFNLNTRESRWESPEGSDTAVLQAYISSLTSSKVPPGKVWASHLLVKHAGSRRPASWKEANITRSKEESRAILERYEEEIRSGRKTLGELAETESDCSSARKRGDLGVFGRGEMQSEFEEVAFALKIGEVSGIVDTPSGLHLIERHG